MRRILLLSVFTIAISYCYGQKIYQADSAEEAQVTVYPADVPNEADLWVCFVWDESELTRTGLWMDMRFDHEAEVIIFFVDEEEEADLKIWLVDTQQESKWLNPEKEKLLKITKD